MMIVITLRVHKFVFGQKQLFCRPKLESKFRASSFYYEQSLKRNRAWIIIIMADEEEKEERKDDCDIIREDNLPYKEINSNLLLPFCEFFFNLDKKPS